MYVPEALVPVLTDALENGRQLEALLYAQGPLMLKEFRRMRDKPEKQPKKQRKTPPRNSNS